LECGARHVFVLREPWTVLHPSGTVHSFESAKALRLALIEWVLEERSDDDDEPSDDEPSDDEPSDLEERSTSSDALELVTISTPPPPRITSIPPVPTADAAIALQPPPPPRRTSNFPTMPIAASESSLESHVTMVLPELALRSETTELPSDASSQHPGEPWPAPMTFAPTETILGLGDRPAPRPPASEPPSSVPPSSAPPISLRNRIVHASEDDLLSDDDLLEDADIMAEAPSLEEAPSSEDALPLLRSVKPGERAGSPVLELLTTSSSSSSSSSSSLEDTVKRRRWTEEDERALTPPPPPRRAGWVVAGGLVAAAAGVVVYLHETSADAGSQPSATTTVTRATALAMPVNEPPAATTSTLAPSTLVVAPEPALPVKGPSLALLGDTPVSVTTTTNATIPLVATAAAPAAEPHATPGAVQASAGAMMEPVSEAFLPLSELLRRANTSLSNGDRRRAQQRFRLALAKDPANVEATTGMGDIARSEGDLVAAREHYRRALERSPSFIPALLALADLDWDRGDRDDAQKNYTAIVDELGDGAPARAKERKGEDAPSP